MANKKKKKTKSAFEVLDQRRNEQIAQMSKGSTSTYKKLNKMLAPSSKEQISTGSIKTNNQTSIDYASNNTRDVSRQIIAPTSSTLTSNMSNPVELVQNIQAQQENQQNEKLKMPSELLQEKLQKQFDENQQKSKEASEKRVKQKKKDEKDNRTWFKSGAFKDGYDFGDVTKTLVGTGADVYQDATKGIAKIGEALWDTGAYAVGGIAKAVGNDDLSEKMKKFIAKNIVEEHGTSEWATNLSVIGVANNILNGKVKETYNLDNLKESAKNFTEIYNLDEDRKKTTSELQSGKTFEEKSVLGDKSDSLVQSAGQLLGTAGLQAVGVPWWLTTGVSSFGGEVENAFNNNATYGEAGTSGLISAGAEVLTEKISGGIKFGGKALDDGLKRAISQGISNKILNTLTKLGVDATGEGAEEVLSEVLQSVGQKLTYEDEKTWEELLTSEEAMDRYLESFIGGAVLGGGSSSIRAINSAKTGRDYDTGLTQNEQSVIDNVVSQRTTEIQKQKAVEEKINRVIEEQEATRGTLTDEAKQEIKNRVMQEDIDYSTSKLSKKEIAKIEEEVRQDLERGEIDIDTIESTLSSEKTARIKELMEERSKTTNEQERLKIQAEIGKLEEAKNSELIEMLKKDNLLQNSYREANLKNEKFTYEAKDTDSEYKKKLAEDFKKLANNSTRTHETFEMISKIAEDSKTNYSITNNEQLKNLGYDIDGKDVNGLVRVNKDGSQSVLINIDSKKAINRIVGHETTHILEGTKEYDEFKEFAKQYATTKGEYDSRLKSTKELYKGVKDANVENEVTADIVGDYLFTDTDFVNSLSVEKPTVFQKVKDLIDDLVVKVKGTKEEKQLREVQKKFKEAYRKMSNTTTKQSESNLTTEADRNTLNNVKYSLEKMNDGTEYVKTENNLFNKEDGTSMTQREIYNSLIGKQITFNDGITATIRQWLPNNKNMYNELFKRYPNYKNVKDIKSLNNNINENIVELLENSDNISPNEPDYMNRHKDNKIDSFDTRRVSFYDGKNAYDLDLSIAKMQDGNYVAYAKRNLFSNKTLLNKIKKEAPTSKSRGVLPYIDNISQNENIVNNSISENIKNDTKYSIQGLENYTKDEIKSISNDYIKEKLEENDLYDVEIKGIAIHGSRGRGTARPDSDLDVVVEYKGDVREDTLFDILNEEHLEIDGIQVDINPITEDGTGTLKDYMARSDEYNKEVLAKVSQPKYSLSDKGTLQDSNGNDVTLETSDTGTHGTLMAIHNLSEDKLKGILELGGFPVPSIAITNPDRVNHKQFGEISVLFDKNTINPSDKLNEVYDRDVWSPTFPTIDSEINKENLESVADEIGIKDYYLEDIAERNSNIEDLIYQVKKHDEVVRKFLDNNNIKYDADIDTYKELRNLATDNGLDTYLRKQLSNILGEKGIYNGKEYLTPSGNRRTFWQLHDKYTLENLVKNLTKGKTTGTQQVLFGAGFGPTSANMNNQFKSIEDIKSAENRIVSSEEQQKQQIGYIANLENAMKPLRQYAVEGIYTSGSEQVYNVIQELSEQKKVNVTNLIKILSEHGFNNVDTISQETLQNVITSLNDLKNMPTDYFEAKPQRAVGLDEVQAIVIPNTTDAEFKQQLQDAGLTYYEYDPNIERDRQRVINQFDDLKFSLSQQGEQIAPSRNDVFGKDIKYQDETTKQVEQAIAPLKEEVKTLTKEITDLRENVAPISLEEAEMLRKESFNSITDKDIAPIKEDTAPEYQYENDNKGTESIYNEISNDTLKNDRELIDEIRETFSVKQYEARNILNDIKKAESKKEIYDILYRNRYYEEQTGENTKELKKRIRNTKLDMSNEKLQMGKQDYNEFRKRNFGNLKLGNDGMSVDSFYQELSEMYPNYFEPSVNNVSDQLEVISDFMKTDHSTATMEMQKDELLFMADYYYNQLENRKLINDHYKSILENLPEKEVSDLYSFFGGEIPDEVMLSNIDNVAEKMIQEKQAKREKIEKNNTLNYNSQNPTKESAYDEPSITNPVDAFLNKELTNRFEKGTKQTVISKQKGKSAFRDTMSYLFVNKNRAIDKFSDEVGNKNIKILADHVNNVFGEISTNISKVQTDNNGKAIGKGITEIFNQARKSKLSEAFDDYLFHKSNIERHKNEKGSIVPANDSARLVLEYEKTYPEFKTWGDEVNNFNKNNLYKQVDAGLISKELADNITNMYDFYVPFFENIERDYVKTDTGEIISRSAVKRAKGGADKNLLGFEKAMMKQTQNTISSIRKNQLYREIIDSTHNKQIGLDLNDGTFADENGYYLTAYEDGSQVSANISKELYDGLNNNLEQTVKDIEQKLSFITKPLQALSNIRRNLLTNWSPTFIITNPIKDFQDAPLNSKYAKDWAVNYPKALKELTTGKGEHLETFLNMYGQANLMGDYSIDSGISDITKSVKIKGKSKLSKLSVRTLNELVELTPRYAEYLASIKNGASQMEALYNAREVTINFGRGGVISKALNRNGFTFWNASVQGFNKLYRNFSGENGAKGVVNASLKALSLGVAPALYNALMFGLGDDEDEDYKVLPDYIKDNYYLIKTDNGNFIRIPKGRMISVFGSAGRRTLELMQGEKDAFDGYLKNAYSQVGISNPMESNILAPLIQAYGSENGKTWYGADIVPSRLQDVPKDEQYDESIDKFSIWLGEKTGISPYKANYVIDQYTGGIGDMILPTITEEAQSDSDSFLGTAIAPLKDKFTADSTTDNKYVSEFYTKNDELKVKSNSSKATEEDLLVNQYMKSVSSEMGALYSEMREVQANKNLSKSEKYKKAQAIKKQINELAEEGLNGYKNVNKTDNYAEVGGREFYKWTNDEGEVVWSKPDEAESDELNAMGLDIQEKSSYYTTKSKIYDIWDKYGDSDNYESKNKEIGQAIINSGLPDEAKYSLYDFSKGKYADKETTQALKLLDLDADTFISYASQTFKADKDSNGKSISGSKKKKVFDYINSMRNISFEQKAILAKLQYNNYDERNYDIIDYLNNSSMTYEEMEFVLKQMGFKVKSDGTITWD